MDVISNNNNNNNNKLSAIHSTRMEQNATNKDLNIACKGGLNCISQTNIMLPTFIASNKLNFNTDISFNQNRIVNANNISNNSNSNNSAHNSNNHNGLSRGNSDDCSGSHYHSSKSSDNDDCSSSSDSENDNVFAVNPLSGWTEDEISLTEAIMDLYCDSTKDTLIGLVEESLKAELGIRRNRRNIAVVVGYF